MAEREKSALYPSSTISECIDFIKAVDSFRSKTVAYAAVAEKYGLKSVSTRSFTQKIGSAKQYGLITTNSSTIQLTELARRILYPCSDDLNNLKKECFQLPPLYAALLEEYEGKALPQASMLGNLLLSKYRITRTAKDLAADVFLKNANELGCIRAGVLSCSIDAEPSENMEKIDTPPEKNSESEFLAAANEFETASATSPIAQGTASDYITQTYPVESGKVAQIIIPIDSTPDDLFAIRDLLEVIMKRKFKLKIDD